MTPKFILPAGLLAALLFPAGGSAHIDPLLRLLRDDSAAVRKAAVEGLEKEGDSAALASLEFLLNDRDDGVRRAAGKAIETLKKYAANPASRPSPPGETPKPPAVEPAPPPPPPAAKGPPALPETPPAPAEKPPKVIPESELLGPFNLRKIAGFQDYGEVTLLVKFADEQGGYTTYKVEGLELTQIQTKPDNGARGLIGVKTVPLKEGDVRDTLILLDRHDFGSFESRYPPDGEEAGEFETTVQYRVWSKTVTDLSPAGSGKTPRNVKNLEAELRAKMERLAGKE